MQPDLQQSMHEAPSHISHLQASNAEQFSAVMCTEVLAEPDKGEQLHMPLSRAGFNLHQSISSRYGVSETCHTFDAAHSS